MSKKLLLCFALSVLALSSCKKDSEFLKKDEATDNTLAIKPNDGLIKLGKQLENPYSITNMKRAWENIKSRYPASMITESNINIRVTHLYLKFKPKDEQELEILKDDTTLVLYSYPLDYEIKKEGDYYHDPAIPSDLPTYHT